MRVLLVDDNPGDVRLMKEIMLGPKSPLHSFASASTLKEGIKRLEEGNIDVLLLDLSLPDGQGVENVINVKPVQPDLPIVVLTGLDDEQTALTALREGAEDYIVKGNLNSSLIYRSLRHAIERKRGERRLREALEAAEIANQTKTTFLANVSHELRTPLNAIMGFSELMCHQIYGPLGNAKYLEYANDIHKSGSYLLELINDLLDLAKAEAGKLELMEQLVHVQDIVQECIELISAQAQSSAITITVNIEENLPKLWADPRLLKQVLLNILTNAIKFTLPNGKITFQAGLRPAGIFLVVEDTGVGIASEDIPRAFSPFGQVHSHTHPQQRGTGLGLPLSRRIIELHGGVLTLTSEINVGTIVTIELPEWRSRQDTNYGGLAAL